LLRGLLFGPNGEKYSPTFTKKASGKRYRYYYPQSDKKYGYGLNWPISVHSGRLTAPIPLRIDGERLFRIVQPLPRMPYRPTFRCAMYAR
jgi:hypothetical protein